MTDASRRCRHCLNEFHHSTNGACDFGGPVSQATRLRNEAQQQQQHATVTLAAYRALEAERDALVDQNRKLQTIQEYEHAAALKRIHAADAQLVALRQQVEMKARQWVAGHVPPDLDDERFCDGYSAAASDHAAELRALLTPKGEIHGKENAKSFSDE
jgi:hypothetical protein